MRLQCAGSASAELFKFSTGSMEWTDLSAANVMSGTKLPTRGHTMTAIGTEIYVFGGYKVSESGEKEVDWCRRQTSRTMS